MQVVQVACPHCKEQDAHPLERRGLGIERPTYRCTACNKLMVQCRLCRAMTCAEGWWADQLCDDHWNQDEPFFEGEIACISEWSRHWRKRPETLLNRAASRLGLRRDIESFQIRKLCDGREPDGVIYVNGLLSQRETNFLDWQGHGGKLFKGKPAYGLRWEARRAPTDAPLADGVRDTAGDLTALVATYGVAAPALWHYTMSRAEATGKLLAAILQQTQNQKFILCGHSLGARVIFFALVELAKRDRNGLIRTAHLLGGALGANDTEEWRLAAGVCEGGINNYFSRNDSVLRLLYRPASAFLSEPIGLGAIGINGIRDIDVSDYVDGHTAHKTRFGEFARWPNGL